MASNDTHEKTVASDPKNISSESTDGEQDRDSMWGSASEGLSDAGSGDVSLSESVSHGILTVRAKTDEGEVSEIQKLIAAAESLALEREKLKLSRFVATRDSLSLLPASVRGRTDAASEVYYQGELTNINQRTENKGVHYGQIPSESNSTGTSTSGYFSISDDTNGVRIIPEQRTKTNEGTSKSDTSRKVYNNLDNQESLTCSNFDSLLSSPSVSDANNISITSKENIKTEDNYSNIPRLRLENISALNNASDIQEERTIVSKVEKEVCNSTIRESSSDDSETRAAPRLTTSRQEHNSIQRQPQTSLDKTEVSGAIHEECGSLLSLALNSTSSLGRLIRLLRQVTTLQLGTDTPRVTENVLQELGEFEGQHDYLQMQLSSASAQLQTSVAQVQGVEILLREQHQEAVRVEQCTSQLLGQVETGLESNGLQHMVAVTSPRRRTTVRMLEDVASALALLLGELGRKTSRINKLEEMVKCQPREIQKIRDALVERDSRLQSCEHELVRLKQKSNAEATSLRQCLAQAEENFNEAQKEKTRISEASKKQAVENVSTIIQLQHKLSDVQREADSRVSELEHLLQAATTEKQTLESSLAEMKDQLRLRTQQINLVDEENQMLVEGLRNTLKHQQAELDQQRQHLDTVSSQKSSLLDRIKDLESELSSKNEQHEELTRETSELKCSITSLEQEHSETVKALQNKIDKSTSVRCELEGQIRSLDFTILQLRTELQMERHRSSALSDETSSLHKKVGDLQERIWSQTRRRRNNSNESYRSSDSQNSTVELLSGKEVSSDCGSCQTPLPPSARPNLTDQGVQCLVIEDKNGPTREEQLHTLLREKDAALEGLQHSLSTEINTKNQELETLMGKVSYLEDQLDSLLSGLEVSATIGNITTEVGRLLQDRTEHLDSLDHSSQVLQEEMSSLALENQNLSKELNVTKRSHREITTEAQESVRKAKQEAREERLAAARLQEKVLQLQAKLDSAVFTLEQERQERRMSDTVHEIKHREFGSLLDRATATLHQSMENPRSSET